MTERMHSDDRHSAGTSQLARLEDLKDYEIADGQPDIRGWDVRTADGTVVGKVDSLIADTGAMEVRFIEVEANRNVLGTPKAEHILVPIGAAQLNDEDDSVRIDRLPATGLRSAPRFGRTSLTSDHDRQLRDYYLGGAPRDAQEHSRFFGKRRKAPADAKYLTLSEERLAVGKREVKKGEVEVSKSVDTRHVEQQVATTQEEVNVERRPARPGMSTSPRIGEDSITVPVMGEELVVEKRTVPVEEIVISKEAVRDTKTVEADLKREKVDVDRKGDVGRAPRP